MKIALFEIHENEKAFFKKQLKGHTLLFFDKPAHEVPIKKYQDVHAVSVFIYSQLKSSLLMQLKKLTLVVTRSTGFDHIDVAYCKSKNISVANVPFYGENTVAEHTFALLLSLSRKVHESHIRTRNEDYSIDGLRGFDLKGKTLGVIGVGHIGLHVIRIAKGFGMHVKAYDVSHNTFLSEVLHFEYTDLNDLLKNSDIVSLHMPYHKESHHFMNRARLSKLKQGAILINTARGGLVDTSALYDLLKKGHIGGAGLDVIEGEELIGREEELMKDTKMRKQVQTVFRDKQIFKMDNVIFTPHNAFNSVEALQRIMDTTVENIVSFAKDGKTRYSVLK